jgi:hypothetical protein
MQLCPFPPPHIHTELLAGMIDCLFLTSWVLSLALPIFTASSKLAITDMIEKASSFSPIGIVPHALLSFEGVDSITTITTKNFEKLCSRVKPMGKGQSQNVESDV